VNPPFPADLALFTPHLGLTGAVFPQPFFLLCLSGFQLQYDLAQVRKSAKRIKTKRFFDAAAPQP
jgi:hypothetical protein